MPSLLTLRFSVPSRAAVRVAALSLVASIVVACGSTPKAPLRTIYRDPPVRSQPVVIPEAPQVLTDESQFITPPHLDGTEPVRVAMLLPLSASDRGARTVAQALRDAASLGVFEMGDDRFLVVPKDTGGTPEGAQRAAQAAIDEGAEMILGPLFATSVTAVRPIARRYNVPVVGFSSDRAAAGGGVYLLSFQVEQEIERVVRFSLEQGLFTFAALVPSGRYGLRVTEIFEGEVLGYGGDIKHIVEYPPNAESFRDPVRRVAEYDERSASLREQRELLVGRNDELSVRTLERLEQQQTWGGLTYQAILLPEGGSTLRTLAPMLPFFDVDNRTVRFLGTGLWDDPSLWREPSIRGGWFAAPPLAAREAFGDRFEDVYGYRPPRIASLAYDAVRLAAVLADAPKGQRFTQERLENPDGFIGIDGIFRFLPTGGTERGLAVMEVKDGTVEVVSPAPERFDLPVLDDPFAPFPGNSGFQGARTVPGAAPQSPYAAPRTEQPRNPWGDG